MKIDWMLVILAALGAMVAASLWKAHRNPNYTFDLFDLIMENGRVSKIAVAFMLVLGVTSWVIISLMVKDKMTESYLTSYGAMWVVPLVAKVVFAKNEPPADGGVK